MIFDLDLSCLDYDYTINIVTGTAIFGVYLFQDSTQILSYDLDGELNPYTT